MTATRHNRASTILRVRPPVLVLVGLALGSVLDHALPLPIGIMRDNGLLHKLIPAIIIAVGLSFFFAGIVNFWRAGTPISGDRPASSLVTSGIHGWSRNPIYVGIIVFYVGVGIAVRSSWILALTPLLAIIIRYAVIALEETYLADRFGDTFTDYRKRVRRWL